MKQVAFGSLILSALPLFIYPFVLLANTMSLAGQHSANEPFVLMLVVNAFLLGSTAYPAVYILCAISTIAYIRKNEGKPAFIYSLIPITYLMLLVGLLALWHALRSG